MLQKENDVYRSTCAMNADMGGYSDEGNKEKPQRQQEREDKDERRACQ
jgi:hypothetical protein